MWLGVGDIDLGGWIGMERSEAWTGLYTMIVWVVEECRQTWGKPV